MSQTAMIVNIAAALFVGFGVVDGFRKGLVKKGIALAFSLLTLAVVYFLSPYVSTALQQILPERILTGSISESGSEIYRMLVLSGLGDTADEYLKAFIARVLSVVLTYVVIRILLGTLLVSLKLLTSVPGLSLLNRMAGAAFGLLQQLLTLWLFFLVVAIFSSTGWGGALYGAIQESGWLAALYENNVLLLVGILLILNF